MISKSSPQWDRVGEMKWRRCFFSSNAAFSAGQPHFLLGIHIKPPLDDLA